MAIELKDRNETAKALLQTTTSPVPLVDNHEALIRQGHRDSTIRAVRLELMSWHELKLNEDRTIQATGRTPFQIEMPLGEIKTVR